MKTFKEYPATHSMMTSWFAIDEEGNVAIMLYEDNGPVPIGTPESAEQEILEIMSQDDDEMPWKNLKLTKDEVQYLLDNSHIVKASDYKDYIDDSIIYVPHSKLRDFIQVAKASDKTIICLDERNELFYFNWFSHNKRQEKTINEAIKCGIIKPVRQIFWDCDGDCTSFKELPFFVYRQSYEPGRPMTRTDIPPFPFTADRLSEEAKNKAHKLPLKFKDIENLQIAEYIPHSALGTTEKMIGNRYYHLMDTPDGKEAYIASSSIYYAGCGKECLMCWCKDDCQNCTYHLQKDRHPTVMVITGIDEIPYDISTSFELPFSKAVFIPIVEGLPDNDRSLSNKKIDDFPIMYMFQFCKTNLEENIRFFNPRVILIYAEVIKYIEEFYTIKNGMIEIADDFYPIFIFEEFEKHIDTIITLADMPYRGSEIEWIIQAGQLEKGK